MKRFEPVVLLTRAEKDRIREEILAHCDLVADCWVYRTQNSEGYGVKKIGGRLMYTSRFMLCCYTHESFNVKADACHVGDCPYRACCNPRHLEWGTHSENSIQREQKRREAISEPGDRFMPKWGLGHETHEERGCKCTVYTPLFEQERLRPDGRTGRAKHGLCTGVGWRCSPFAEAEPLRKTGPLVRQLWCQCFLHLPAISH